MDDDGRSPQYPHTHNFQQHYDPNENHPPTTQSHHYTQLHSQHPQQYTGHRQQQQAPLADNHQPHHSPSFDPALHGSQGWVYNYNNQPPNFGWPQQQFVPTLPSSTDVTRSTNSQYYQQPYPAQPASFQSPRPGYYLNPATPSPYAYHASPHPSAYPSPISRSMSTGTVSSTGIDQVPSAPRAPQQSQNTFLPTPRQIRFVSTDGQPHAKRRRINAACLTCRKRKTRCSGERPICKTCTDNGHKCAGYADKATRKDNDKRPDDGDGNDEEDDGDSPPSSPRRQQPEAARTSNKDTLQAQVPSMLSYPMPESTMQTAAHESAIDLRSPVSNYTVGSGSANASRTRVPFFRYFGPTAIVPGFKQMVVQMKDGRENRRDRNSVSSDSPVLGPYSDLGGGRALSPALVELPYYDATDPNPNAPLITLLCESFFDHLGCNYPFLQRERFLKDLGEKRVDAILVNAVCAVAARFASDPVLARPSDDSLPLDNKGAVKRAFRGQPFAQRAMSAVVDTFSCPTLAVTQACLLLAYEEFGSDRDSGLWMYLGTSIRMAQDLGIQKLEGMQLEGRLGPTPKTAKSGHSGKSEEAKRAEQQSQLWQTVEDKDGASLEDRRASEKERIDTFWAVFFLDRAVSSGVGRPVTLRDKDIEISFPYRNSDAGVSAHPDPFPAMIRIVHMYGRVADVLNNIKEVTEVTPDVLQRLAGMEKDLTGIYQKLSTRLHFNATNFQHYVKVGQGTNFILLHFWFHTLIVLLHQPMLLHSFEGRIQQLFPDSRELSMSSAKTIADILAFAELIDVKSFIGNPFTSQPMYVAACAFLAEAAAHASQPPSRPHSPHQQNGKTAYELSVERKEAEQKMAAKHTLLASAANQNYQRCYKALKTLDSYWAGCRYILTALDQKSEGLASPLLFTLEDVDGEMPSTEPSFTTPGWRRTSFGVSLGGPAFDKVRLGQTPSQDTPWSPRMGNAIGWSITGTASSPAPNLSFLYQNSGADGEKAGKPQHMRPHFPQPRPGQSPMQQYPHAQAFSPSPQPSMLPPVRTRKSSLPYDPVSTAEADLLLGLHSPYSVGSSNQVSTTSNPQQAILQQQQDYQSRNPPLQTRTQQPFYGTPPPQGNFSDMFIESQDIDMSNEQNFNINNFTFPGGEMIPWLEYLPQDVLNYFADSGDMMAAGANGNATHGDVIIPSGPGPPQAHSSLGLGGLGPSGFRRPQGGPNDSV